MVIRDRIVNKGHPNRPGRWLSPEIFVIHYTPNFLENNSASHYAKMYNRDYCMKDNEYYEICGKPFRLESYHKVIDYLGCVNVIPLDEVAIGTGEGFLNKDNGYGGYTPLMQSYRSDIDKYTIHYQICLDDNWQQAWDNAAKIVALDSYMLKISPMSVVRHYDITGKICPAPFLEEPTNWYRFIEKVRSYWLEFALVDHYKHRDSYAEIKPGAEMLELYRLRKNTITAQNKKAYVLGCKPNGECIIAQQGSLYITSESYIDICNCEEEKRKNKEDTLNGSNDSFRTRGGNNRSHSFISKLFNKEKRTSGSV